MLIDSGFAARLDRYTAPNENSVPAAAVGGEPYSGPRRAERAKRRQSTSQGLRVSWDIKGGCPWLVAAVTLVLTLAAPAAAQNEAALRAFFEGMRVTLKLDMPGTSDGVDVRADARRALDYQRHGERLKVYGTAIHSGESATVTLVKVKKDLIEFQLNGGGFGTFGDDTSTSVSLPYVEKSRRERDLEKRLDDETDPRQRRDLRREIDELRDRRDRENRRIDVERARLEEIKRQRIADERLRAGSRFNLRYSDEVPSGIRPEEVMAVLADYVDFTPLSERPFSRVESAAPPPGREALPRKGMTRADAERLFGRPVESSDRREGTLAVSRVVFTSGEQRLIAEFVEDILVRYTLTSK